MFAIDFDEKSVRVSRCLNLIAGDGETNVLHLNTLDWTKWDETVKQDDWSDTYGDGWRRLRRQRAGNRQADYRQFKFDILMANPPFAGDIKQSDCPSSNKWDRCLVLLRECFAHHFHVTRRVVDSANDVSRWSFV